MFIVPFIHKAVNENNMSVNSIDILTIGGKTLWEESNTLDIDKDLLNANDIYRKENIIEMDKDIKLCEIDINKTNVKDFFKWNEIDLGSDDLFCWRNYIYVTNNKKKDVWMDIPEKEKLSDISVKNIIFQIMNQKNEYN